MTVLSSPTTAATTLPELLLEAVERHAGTAMRVRRGDAWQETTFAELGAAAREVAGGLIALGVRAGDRVAILGSTRPEWTLADCGALCAGATVVPVYHTNSPEECQYVLAHSAARVLICEDAAQLAKVASVRDRLPALEHVFTMLPAEGARSLSDLRTIGDPAAVASVAVAPMR